MDSNIKEDGLYLFKLFGFEVRLDWTWFFPAILITWTLAAGYFPLRFPGFSVSHYWIMGIAGAIGLFLSIILHELCHSLVGRLYDIPISGIKLFVFGGIAKMSAEPPSPKSEFLMAGAGPLLSIGLGVAFYILLQIGTQANWPILFNGVISYLSMINFVLAVFNLLPGFPLDGGRILRSILWWWSNDLKWATRIASKGGTWLGFSMIFFGIIQFIQGALIAGLWMVLIGFFLQSLSKMSYKELFIKEMFRGEAIKKYVKTNPIWVESDMTLQELVDNYFYQYYHKLYPVMRNGRLVGSISFDTVGEIEKKEWPSVRVKQVMSDCSEKNVVDVETDVAKVLEIMQAHNVNRLIVTQHGKLYGMITLKDLMDIVFIKRVLRG
ncbi:inosine 5'-monophosphate dehydrogenase [Legionella lansingensis]|uniref:Zinc metalloprotease n=1 Tax=Legionella lansingensis TaxID=45067 RepID=A0A0W0VF50_9GAMM|nr:site-2 protease family protein [Legionella lansingensis]KTD18744.1 putative zinc metalloprotease Rip3 [Legionella lansingensis]SNV58427.1 inosine 5'-monophosphate dehydrogenase [Legionella lansingensis]